MKRIVCVCVCVITRKEMVEWRQCEYPCFYSSGKLVCIVTVGLLSRERRSRERDRHRERGRERERVNE